MASETSIVALAVLGTKTEDVILTLRVDLPGESIVVGLKDAPPKLTVPDV
jgi:hypothetical protein